MNNPDVKTHQIKPLEGYPPDIGRLLWMSEDTRRRKRVELENLDQAALDWFPSRGSNSIGSILYHIAAIETSGLFTDVLQQEFPPEIESLFPYDVSDSKGQLNVVKGISLPEHLERFDITRIYLLTSI